MSDVIIKGMEMPECCAECELNCNTGGIWEIGEDYCCVGSIGNEIDDSTVRQVDCPLHPAPEWISVEERLPEDETEVLTLVKYEWAKKHYYSLDAYSHIDGGWVRNEGVTHWMPLPEPPEGGDDDG